VEDDTRSGWPSSSRNEDNVVHITDMIREDHTVTVRMLADALFINKSTCHQILREDLGKRKLNARLDPHALTQDQKEVRASICAALLHEAQNDATFINVSLPRMNHGVSSTTLRPRGKGPNGGQRVLYRQRK